MIKEEILKYLRGNELDIQHANASYFACDLVYTSYSGFESICGLAFNPVFVSLSYKNESQIDFYQIIPKQIIKNTAKGNYNEYISDPKSFESKKLVRKKLENDLDKLWSKYQAEKNNLKKQELVTLFKNMVLLSRKWWYYGAIGEDKGDVINLVVVPQFANRHKINLAEASDILSFISHPDKQTIFNLERGSFLKLCEKFLKGEKIDEEIEAHLKKYFWFKTNFYEAEKITQDSLLKDVFLYAKENGLDKVKKEIEEMKKNFGLIRKRKEELLSKLTLNSEDKRDIYFANDVIEWSDRRKETYMKQFYYLFTFIKEVADKEKIPYHDLVGYAVDEFVKFLEKGERLSREEIEKRRKGIFVAWEKGAKRKMFYGDEARELFDAVTSFEHKGDIKGQVASIGKENKIVGRARVIMDPDKAKLSDGEILVTSMTRVEFVPLMRKAKAIITDEGGVACHAAIISRELGIPCVIGTKVATKIIKDGDEIEIDTNSGIVKINK